MNTSDGLAHLASLSPSHIKMGLERVRDALRRLGNPERKFAALHVAGTNGKGSTCAIAASCLGTRYRTGLYTSPHLEKPNERIRIGGEDISDELLGQRVAEVVSLLGLHHELTYFELFTLVAFWHFAQERVRVVVVETGLGGRLDATTACAPQVTTVTPIDFDHMQFLGDTIEAIAAEKAGIIKPGVPVVSSQQSPSALSLLEGTAQGPFLLEGRDFSVQPQRDGQFEYRGWSWRIPGLRLPLKGPHQRQNLAVALASLEALSHFPLEAAQVKQGVEAARWPGRFEVFQGVPPVVLDGAHNLGGVRTLIAALNAEFPSRPVHMVFGVFADKDVEPMVRALFPKVAAVHLVPVASPRSRDPLTLEALARELVGHVTVHRSAEEGLAAARTSAPADGVVVVAGSLFLVGQLRAAVALEVFLGSPRGTRGI